MIGVIDYGLGNIKSFLNVFDRLNIASKVIKINSDFEVISQNEISIQAISHKNKKIFCTQYHPELPFNFIGKLMNYWKKNYSKIFNNDEFENRLILLSQLEQENYFNRKLEIENWLKST